MKKKLKHIYNLLLFIIIWLMDICAVLFIIYNIIYITFPLIEKRSIIVQVICYVGIIPIFFWLNKKLTGLFTKNVFETLKFEIYE